MEKALIDILEDSSDYEIILMGDFNTDAAKYTQFLRSCNDVEKIPKKFFLINYLYMNNYFDAHYKTEDGKIMATFSRTVQGALRQSRIDYIWTSQSLTSSILINKTWATNLYYKSDHRLIMTYLSKDPFKNSSPSQSRVKQNKLMNFNYNFKEMDQEKIEYFSHTTDSHLQRLKSSRRDDWKYDEEQKRLNKKWDLLKTVITMSANEIIPRHWHKEKSSKPLSSNKSPDIDLIYSYIRMINRVIVKLENKKIAENKIPKGKKWTYICKNIEHILDSLNIEISVLPKRIDQNNVKL